VAVTEPLLVALIAAVCLSSGVPWVLVATLVLGTWMPALGLVALGMVIVARRRRQRPSDEAVVLSAVAAELRRGASVRTAIEPAAARSAQVDLSAAVRLAEAGAPIERVATAFAAGLPDVGRLAGPALEAAATSGGRAAAIFARLADRASAHLELVAERRALTAQARLSAAVVGAIPCLVLGWMAVTGRLSAMLAAGPVAATVVGLGSVLMAGGLGVVALLTRRALP
jgi:Flp pilus assembly protein TadB